MPKMNIKRGESVKITFVCPAGILKESDRRIVRRIRDASGWKANRSRLLQALLNLAASNAVALKAAEVVDQMSFERALGDAIAKGSRAKAKRR